MKVSGSGLGASPALSTRVAWSFALMTALILACLGAYLNHRMLQTTQAYDRLELNERLDAIAAIVAAADTADARLALSQALRQQTFGRPRMLMWILVDGVAWASTTPQPPPLRTGPSTLADASGEPLYLVVVRRQAELADGRHAELVAAVDHDMSDAFMRRFYLDLALGFLAAIGLIGGLGWLIVWRAASPLRAAALHARQIDPDQLGRRVPVAGLPREAAPLVEAFNQALDRVEDGYRRLETFNADIAHELRTPLQNMIGQAQVVLSRPRSSDVYVDVLQSLLEEADQLRRMTADMLFITSSAGARLTTEPVDVLSQVTAVLAFFEISAEERGIRLQAAGTAVIEANASLLRRALSNLVDNALKYASPASEVAVDVTIAGQECRVVVANDGPEIPPEQLPRLFDRFWRGQSHRDDSGGAGLGLAIVRTIMQMHGGRVDARSRQGRTAVTLRFPLQQQVARSTAAVP